MDIATTMDEELFDVAKIRKAMLLKHAILEINTNAKSRVPDQDKIKVQDHPKRRSQPTIDKSGSLAPSLVSSTL